MKKNLYPQSKQADIGLILEGSYPFVFGGVSQWVHQIIQNFPQYSFAIFFLGGRPENLTAGLRYQLPKNVVHLQIDYLFPDESGPIPEKISGDAEGFEKVRCMHEKFRQANLNPTEAAKCPFDFSLDTINSIDYKQFLYSKKSWDFIAEQYTQYCTDPSFIDYFWTVRNVHQPLWQLTKIVPHIPKLQLVHTISTGYAGLLGALLHDHYHYPLILSEHGIYTKERRIDIFQTDIVRDYSLVSRSMTDISYLRDLWNRYFEALGKACYQVADPIISLFSDARQLQLEGGAAETKTRIIPNGVNIDRYKSLRRPLAEKQPIIGFVGRLVPIKDVKDFIRAIALIRMQLPNIKVWIIGGEDENPEYAKECHELMENLGLSAHITFKSHQKMEDVLPVISLVVLSSISEGMPLIVLESFAAGVPVVATDVGACRELIEGVGEADQAIGHSGKVVKIADPQNLAQAVIDFMNNPTAWEKASAAGIKRVEKFYDETRMIAQYQQIYATHLRNRETH